MAKSAVCPYYGCNEDVCDVGCGYISSHDASQISRYCSSDYQGCPKLSELIDRNTGELYTASNPRSVLLEKKPDYLSSESGIAVGLSATGLALLVYAFQKFGLFGESVLFAGSLIMLISALQMVIGLFTLKKMPIRGMMFIGSGLMWVSMLAMDLLPAAGIGASPGPYALSGYLYLWGLFCLFPLQAAVRVSLYCRLFFGLCAIYLLLQAATPYFSAPFQVAAFMIGTVAGLVGLGASLRFVPQFGSNQAETAIDRV